MPRGVPGSGPHSRLKKQMSEHQSAALPENFTDTPEFKIAVADAATAAAQLAVEEMLRKMGQPLAVGPGGVPDTTLNPSGVTPASMDSMALLQGLALAIAEVSDQGTSRKRVAPEVLNARAKARVRMEEMVKEAKALPADSTEIPIYELTGKIYFDEHFVDPYFRDTDHVVKRRRIQWDGVPNEAMLPVNDRAHAIHQAFLDSIGTVVKTAPTATVTAKGLTIMGPSVRGKMVATVGADLGMAESGSRFRTLGETKPGQVTEVAVLGTVAPRARQVA